MTHHEHHFEVLHHYPLVPFEAQVFEILIAWLGDEVIDSLQLISTVRFLNHV
jgi:hypothetical protein